MERAEAEAIYDAGREAVVGALVALAGQVEALLEANRALTGRLERLEERVRRSSRNSSLPPSSDPPGAAPRPPKPASGRRRGGQAGHPGTTRMLAPPERVDELVEHWPERCGRCGRGLAAEAAGEPERHQLWELPALAVTVIEHRLHACRCCCGQLTRARLPAGVPRSPFGPRLHAAVATLVGRHRLSRRDTARLVGELFGCPLSTGAIDAILGRVGAALAAPYLELRETIKCAPAVNADETGWALAGRRRWLWGGFTPRIAVFSLEATRGQAAAKRLLGESPSGIVCSDRWSGYSHLPAERRQLCWAHLARDFQAVAERRGAEGRLGRALRRETRALFAAWDAYRAHGEQARLAAELAPAQERLRTLLERGARGRRPQSAALCATLLSLWPALWTFLSAPQLVQPTNNLAERCLRPAVIQRKLSFGNDSERGLRTTERLLSASGTCRLQGRSLFAYLCQALAAAFADEPVPSLTTA